MNSVIEGVVDAMFAVVDDGLCLLDPEGRVSRTNSAWLEMTAYTSEEVVGRNLWDLFPSSPADVRALVEEARAGKTVDVPEHSQLRDGTARWYTARAAPVKLPEGVGAVIRAVDVTDKRRAEEAHRESEERFRTMADSAPALIWVADVEGRNQFVNRTYCEYFHVTNEQVEGDGWRPLIHPEDEARYVASLLRSIAERTSFAEELRVKHTDGTWRWLRSVAEPRVSPKGELLGVVGLSADITERKTIQEALQQSEARLQSVLGQMMEGCQLIGFDWRYLYVNESVTRHGRRTADAMLGRTIMEVFPGIDTTPLFDTLRRCMTERVALRFENEFVHDDGTSAWFDLSIQPREEGLFILSNDITERKRGYEALQRSELSIRAIRDELSAVVEACNIPLIAVDLEGLVTFWSGAAERLFGWTAAEAIGRHSPCVPADRLDEVAAFRQGMAAAKSIDDYVSERCDRHGRRIPMRVSTALRRGPSGAANGLVIALVDLSEQTSLRGALAESENLFRATFEGSPIAKLLCRIADRHVIEVNRAYLRLLGISRADLIGRPGSPVAFSDGVYDHFWNAVDHGERTIDFELPFRASDGREGELVGSAERILVGGEAYVLIAMQDVTESKKAERALRESNERFRQLAETIREVFWLTDPTKGQLIYVSPGYEAIWGRSMEGLFTSPGQWMDAIHPDDRERVKTAAFTKQIAGTYDEEYRIVRPDGSVRWIRDRAFPVRNAAGEVIRMAGAAEDVSDRRRLETQLRQAQKMEAVGRLAGGIAHDFNNLLTVILSYAATALEELNPNEPLRADIIEIEAAGRRASELTGQLLAFSRQQVLQPKVIDLNESLSRMRSMLQRLLGEDVELRAELPASLWSVSADQGQIEQIIMNLAVNARDAMPSGGKLTVETSNVVLDERFAQEHRGITPGPHVMLAVSDSGAGMDKLTQASIFEPFFTTKEVGKGTGLGLSTVLGIVEQSGGTVEVSSELGVGTTFRVYLPRSEQLPHTSLGQPPLPRAVAREVEVILLVEDDEQVRRLTQTLLARSRYQVLVAASPGEAVVASERHEGRIDLLLTDVVMPAMNGRQLAERLKGSRPAMKVLYMSGYTANVVLRHGVEGDGPNLVNKPFTPETLSRAVRSALDASA
jgi:two-component system cell cycle sensor histidine kinase/response regulator CckA